MEKQHRSITMKNDKRNRYIVLFMALFISSSGFTQQNDSLMHYMEIAIANNPKVLQKLEEYKASVQKQSQVNSLPDPQLEMGIFLRPMELMSGNQIADIKLMQMFPWFGVLKNSKDEMSLMAKAKFEIFRDAKLELCNEVQQSWLDIYKIRKNIQISNKNLDLLKTIERLSIIKYKSASQNGSSGGSMGGSMSEGSATSNSGSAQGMSSMGGSTAPTNSTNTAKTSSPASISSSGSASAISNVYQIQIEIAEIEDNIASLQNEEKALTVKFNSQLDKPLNSSIWVPDSIGLEKIDMKYLSISDSLFLQNPMLTMIAYEQKSLDAKLKMQKKMGMPMVGLGLNYSVLAKNPMVNTSMNGKDMIMPMVSVTLPVYRKKYNALESEIKSMKNASAQNYRSTTNSMQIEYANALQSYYEAQRRIKLYDKQSKLAKKTLEIIINSFSSSSSSLIDILRIREQLFNFEIKQLEATVDYNKAVAMIKRLAP